MNTTRTRGLLLALATAVISGFAIWINGNGVAAYGDPSAYTTAKNAASAVVIGVVFLVARSAARARGAAGSVALTRPTRSRQWWGLAYVAILGGAVPFTMFFAGLASTASTQAAFVHKTLFIWVALLAVPLLKEKVTWWHASALALLIIGVFGLAGTVALVPDSGTLLIAGATGLWAVEVVISKRLLAGVTPWTVSVARMGGGSLALLLWAASTGSLGAVVPATAAQWGWVALTGIVLAGYVLTWHQALWRAPAVDVTAVLVLGAVITALLAGSADPTALAIKSPWLAALIVGGALIWAAPASTAAPGSPARHLTPPPGDPDRQPGRP
ncbi:DMT family transporter [Demequina sp. NBRC 110052]|uniref:DMT family transporter n=1 Tax=Demequina sp. NBRC 110052 TaxID=1570341 RepID=UPI000A062EF6|nr:DMT family transporter [Demequina sp. NBRC 110052]